MHKITPFLWFDHQADSAMNYFLSIFKNSKILNVNRANRKVMSGDVRTRRPTVHGPERQSEMHGVVPLCMAANWMVLGRTTGRGKDDQTNRPNRSIKAVWGYPLTPRFRELLQET